MPPRPEEIRPYWPPWLLNNPFLNKILLPGGGGIGGGVPLNILNDHDEKTYVT